MKEQDWLILKTLAETLSITRTAERLYVTQPSLTKRLQRIEAEFCAQIAIRGPKGLTLTPQGEYLAAQAGRMLQEHQNIRRDMLKITDGTRGTIQIGVTNSYGLYNLPPLLQQYKRLHRDVHFGITSGMSGQIVHLVERREAHVGFIRGDHKFDGPFHLLGVDQAQIAFKTPIDLADLPDLPRITYDIDPNTNKLIDHWWYGHFSTPPVIGIHVNHGDTCREMVSNGLGYGIFLVPEFVGGDSELFHMPLYHKNGQPFLRNAWMIYRHESGEIPLIRNFIDFIVQNTAPQDVGVTQ
jgi:DNA-binding transcriptional LysR family regulator